MILADTSIWVEHLRKSNKTLAGLLDSGTILSHPFVIGEIALGNLAHRELVLSSLSDLPRAGVATDDEVLGFIESHALHGHGIGYVDAHLLASVRLTQNALLWTTDKRLHGAAFKLDLAFKSA